MEKNYEQDEVISLCKKYFDINLTKPTLLRYERQGLITKPERGGGGPGGRWSRYCLKSLYEIYAAWVLIHGQYIDLPEERAIFAGKIPTFSPEIIAIARQQGTRESKGNQEKFYGDYFRSPSFCSLVGSVTEIWKGLLIAAKIKIDKN